jgi:hypothetical protein
MGSLQLAEGIAPNVGKVYRLWNRAVFRFGQFYIVYGGVEVALMEIGIAGIWQYLVDAAAEHDVAAQEYLDELCGLRAPFVCRFAGLFHSPAEKKSISFNLDFPAAFHLIERKRCGPLRW